VKYCNSRNKTIMCSSRKYPYSPHRRDWNFLGGGGFFETKKFKEMYGAQLEFPEGWGGVRKNPFRGGGMDIFRNYTMMEHKLVLIMGDYRSAVLWTIETLLIKVICVFLWWK